MSPVLYALVLWTLASVPLALFFGAVCRLSEWPLDADAERIARQTAQQLAMRRAALGVAHPGGGMTAA